MYKSIWLPGPHKIASRATCGPRVGKPCCIPLTNKFHWPLYNKVSQFTTREFQPLKCKILSCDYNGQWVLGLHTPFTLPSLDCSSFPVLLQQDDWDKHAKNLNCFIRTKARPHIFYKPKRSTQISSKRHDESKELIKGNMTFPFIPLAWKVVRGDYAIANMSVCMYDSMWRFG